MDFDMYMECLRRKFKLDSNKIDLKAILRKFPEIDPNEPQIDP